MPDAQGNFKGTGWSLKKELAWERIFAPKGEHKYVRPKVTPVTKKP